MMRRALLAILALAAAACSAPTGLHWPRSSGAETVVYLAPGGSSLPADVRAAADRAARDWSAAPHLLVRWANTCPTIANCVTITAPPDMGAGDGNAWLASGAAEHIVAARIQTGSSGETPPPVYVYNATCHELGHALGLAHGTGVGPCEGGHPTAWDLTLIGQAYADRDATGPPGL